MIDFNTPVGSDPEVFIRNFNRYSSSYVRLSQTMSYLSERRYNSVMKLPNQDEKNTQLSAIFWRLLKEVPLWKGKTKQYFAELTHSSAFEFAKSNTLDYDSFYEFFPAMAKQMDEKQYMKCVNCSKNGDCAKGYDCLTDIEDQGVGLSECEKGVKNIVEMNNAYLKQLDDYSTRYEIWNKEYNKWFHMNDTIQWVVAPFTGVDVVTIALGRDGYITKTLQENKVDRSVINIDSSDWDSVDIYSGVGIFRVNYYYKNEYISGKVSQILANKPIEPSKPQWGNILCVDCRNIIDMDHVGSLTNVEIQMLNECIINSDKKKEEKKPDEKKPDEKKPDEPIPPKPTPTPKPAPVPTAPEQTGLTWTEILPISILAGFVLFLAK